MTAVDFIFRVQPFPSDDMLLTTCPKCQHNFPVTSCCHQTNPLMVSATLHLPPSSASTSCTVTLQARQVHVGMSGGGIVHDKGGLASHDVVLQKGGCGGKLTVNCQSGTGESSPSDPIVFVIPSPSPFLSPPSPPDADLERLSSTMKALRLSGWYYEGLSWQESATLLVPTAPGTFLVRDSSDPRFLFSLSVQTDRGPTSVRLHYHEGNFRLDAAPKLIPVMPLFQCVVRLIEYYVAITSKHSACTRTASGKEQVWIDCSGRTYSSILLNKPLYQKERFPSLQHLARLSINRMTQSGTRIPIHELPESLHSYLAHYPYSQ